MTLVDTATAAVAFGVKPATIRLWVHRGKLKPAATTGGRHSYRLDDLLAIRDRRTRAVDNAA